MSALSDLAATLQSTPYRLIRPLARGGMGDVVVVEHEELGEHRVMKLVRLDRKATTGLGDRLRAEARALTRLRHRNLVRVLDCGKLADDRVFIVSELLEGETLTARIRARGPHPTPDVVGLGVQLLDGLAVVHDAGVVHRDIKPDNVFLTREGELKILDFGIAKFVTAAAKLAAGPVPATATAMVLGTPGYIAPEQLRGEQVDARVDLYAAGCLVFALFSGRPPFEARDQMALFRAHLFDPPPPLGRGAAVDAWVARALAKTPADRFSDARTMRAALAAIVATTPAPSASHAPSRSAVQLAPRRLPVSVTEFMPTPNVAPASTPPPEAEPGERRPVASPVEVPIDARQVVAGPRRGGDRGSWPRAALIALGLVLIGGVVAALIVTGRC